MIVAAALQIWSHTFSKSFDICERKLVWLKTMQAFYL